MNVSNRIGNELTIASPSLMDAGMPFPSSVGNIHEGQIYRLAGPITTHPAYIGKRMIGLASLEKTHTE